MTTAMPYAEEAPSAADARQAEPSGTREASAEEMARRKCVFLSQQLV